MAPLIPPALPLIPPALPGGRPRKADDADVKLGGWGCPRKVAIIFRDESGFRLVDVSPSGTSIYVNGIRKRDTWLNENDMIAILYRRLTGCPWRYLPRDGFPPRSTVYNIFCKVRCEGPCEAIRAELHVALRQRLGHKASPCAAILDSQTVKSAERGLERRQGWL